MVSHRLRAISNQATHRWTLSFPKCELEVSWGASADWRNAHDLVPASTPRWAGRQSVESRCRRHRPPRTRWRRNACVCVSMQGLLLREGCRSRATCAHSPCSRAHSTTTSVDDRDSEALGSWDSEAESPTRRTDDAQEAAVVRSSVVARHQEQTHSAWASEAGVLPWCREEGRCS